MLQPFGRMGLDRRAQGGDLTVRGLRDARSIAPTSIGRDETDGTADGRAPTEEGARDPTHGLFRRTCWGRERDQLKGPFPLGARSLETVL